MSFKPQYHIWSKEDFNTPGDAVFQNSGVYTIKDGVAKMIPDIVPYWNDGPWDVITGWDKFNGMDTIPGITGSNSYYIHQSTGHLSPNQGDYGNEILMYGQAFYTDVRGGLTGLNVLNNVEFVSGSFVSFVDALTGSRSVAQPYAGHQFEKLTAQFKYRSDAPALTETAPHYAVSGVQNPDGTYSYSLKPSYLETRGGLSGWLSQGLWIDRGTDFTFIELSPWGARTYGGAPNHSAAPHTLLGTGNGNVNPDIVANGSLKEIRVVVDFPDVSIYHEDGYSSTYKGPWIQRAASILQGERDGLYRDIIPGFDPYVGQANMPWTRGNLADQALGPNSFTFEPGTWQIRGFDQNATLSDGNLYETEPTIYGPYGDNGPDAVKAICAKNKQNTSAGITGEMWHLFKTSSTAPGWGGWPDNIDDHHHTFSCYIKNIPGSSSNPLEPASEGTSIRLYGTVEDGAYNYGPYPTGVLYVDYTVDWDGASITTGALITGGPTVTASHPSGGFTYVGNDWWRIWCSLDMGATGLSEHWGASIVPSTGLKAGAGIYMWNAQIVKSDPLSPFPKHEPYIAFGAPPILPGTGIYDTTYTPGTGSYPNGILSGNFGDTTTPDGGSIGHDPVGVTGLAGFVGRTWWDEIHTLYNQSIGKSASGYVQQYSTIPYTIQTDPWYPINDVDSYVGAFVSADDSNGGKVTISPMLSGSGGWVDYTSVTSAVVSGEVRTAAIDLKSLPPRSGSSPALRFKLTAQSFTGGAPPEIDDIHVISKPSLYAADIAPNWKESAFPKDINFFIDHNAWTAYRPPVHHQDSVMLPPASASYAPDSVFPSAGANTATGRVQQALIRNTDSAGISTVPDGLYGKAWKLAQPWHNFSGTFMSSSMASVPPDGIFGGQTLFPIEKYFSATGYKLFSGNASVDLSTQNYLGLDGEGAVSQKASVRGWTFDRTLPLNDQSEIDLGFITKGVDATGDYRAEHGVANFEGTLHISEGPGVVATIHEGGQRHRYYLEGTDYRTPAMFSLSAILTGYHYEGSGNLIEGPSKAEDASIWDHAGGLLVTGNTDLAPDGNYTADTLSSLHLGSSNTANLRQDVRLGVDAELTVGDEIDYFYHVQETTTHVQNINCIGYILDTAAPNPKQIETVSMGFNTLLGVVTNINSSQTAGPGYTIRENTEVTRVANPGGTDFFRVRMRLKYFGKNSTTSSGIADRLRIRIYPGSTTADKKVIWNVGITNPHQVKFSLGARPRLATPSRLQKTKWDEYWTTSIEKHADTNFTLLKLTGQITDHNYLGYSGVYIEPRTPFDTESTIFNQSYNEGYPRIDRGSMLIEGWFRPYGILNTNTGDTQGKLIEILPAPFTSAGAGGVPKDSITLYVNNSGNVRLSTPLSVSKGAYGTKASSYYDVGWQASTTGSQIVTGSLSGESTWGGGVNPIQLESDYRSIQWGEWNHIGVALDTRAIGDKNVASNQPVDPNYSGQLLHGSRSSKLYLELNGEIVDSLDVALDPYSATGYQVNELGTSLPLRVNYIESWPKIPCFFRPTGLTAGNDLSGDFIRYAVNIAPDVVTDLDAVRFASRDGVCARTALGTLGSKTTPPQFVPHDSPKVPVPITGTAANSGGAGHYEFAHIYRMDQVSSYAGWDEGFGNQHLIIKNYRSAPDSDLYGYDVKPAKQLVAPDFGPKGRPALRIGPGAAAIVPFDSFDERIFNGPKVSSLSDVRLEESSSSNEYALLYLGGASNPAAGLHKNVIPWSTDLGYTHSRSTSDGHVRFGSFVKLNKLPSAGTVGDLFSFNELGSFREEFNSALISTSGHGLYDMAAMMYVGVSGISNNSDIGRVVYGTRYLDQDGSTANAAVGPFTAGFISTGEWMHIGLDAVIRSGTTSYLQLMVSGETSDIETCTFSDVGAAHSNSGAGVGYRGRLGLGATGSYYGLNTNEVKATYPYLTRSEFVLGGAIPNPTKEAEHPQFWRYMDASYSEFVVGYGLDGMIETTNANDTSSWSWPTLANSNGQLITGNSDTAVVNDNRRIGPIYGTGTPLTGVVRYPETSYDDAGTQVLWGTTNLGDDYERLMYKGMPVFEEGLFMNAASYYAVYENDNSVDILGSDDSPIQLGTKLPSHAINLALINGREWSTENVLTNFDLSDRNYANITNVIFGNTDLHSFYQIEDIIPNYLSGVYTSPSQLTTKDVDISSMNVWSKEERADNMGMFMHLLGGDDQCVYVPAADLHSVSIQTGTTTGDFDLSRYSAYHLNLDKVYDVIECRDVAGELIPYDEFPYSLIVSPYPVSVDLGSTGISGIDWNSGALGGTTTVGDNILGYKSTCPTGEFLPNYYFTTMLIAPKKSIGKSVFIHYPSVNIKTNNINLKEYEVYNPIPTMEVLTNAEIFDETVNVAPNGDLTSNPSGLYSPASYSIGKFSALGPASSSSADYGAYIWRAQLSSTGWVE